MKTPMSSDTKLMKDEECELVDSTKYQGMIDDNGTDREIWCIGYTLHDAMRRVDNAFPLHYAYQTVSRYRPPSTVSGRRDEGRVVRSESRKIATTHEIDRTHASEQPTSDSKNIPQDTTTYRSRQRDGRERRTAWPVNYYLGTKAIYCVETLQGACVFTDRWRLDELAYGIPSDGPYQTYPPSIEDIISSIGIDREGQVCRIRHEEEIDVHDYQILTCEIIPTLKPLEEIIWENIFCLGGNWDHVPACLCFMLYCVVHSKRFNLAYYMAKRMEWVTKQARIILPYGMLLTRLFTFIMNEYPKLNNESYVLYDHVMTPLAAQLERKPRRDRGMGRGRHSTSSSSAFDQPSSYHINDDDDDRNNEGTSRESTPSLIRYVNSLTNQVP
ncbi:hypothetical protein Tco_0910655 [Tanacetum coccineum]|uniref:Uncharacterized protein n=1 Tax=Tanacetum coccineum TaxID=301880 RepID=A0ABQ5CTJ2_9ASTR